MATTTINLNDRPTIHGTPEMRVYTKMDWNADFQLQSDVLVEEIVWNVAPSISTANLQYRFGNVKNPGDDRVTSKLPADSRGWFVLIIVTGDRDDPPLHWLGFAESAITTQTYPDDSGGVQTIPCYGLDRVLQMTPLDTTVFKNPDDQASEEALRRSKAAPFNPRKPGNRTNARVVVQEQSGSQSEIQSYVFANPSDDDTEWWSTQNFFEYLFACHLLVGEQGSGNIPWTLAGDLSVLPEWDRLTIQDPDQRSIHSLVSETLGADRMLGWSIQSVINTQSSFLHTTPVVQEVQIVPFSRLDVPLALPSVGAMPANSSQIIWESDLDPATASQVQIDDSDTVDQVIVRGPLEIGVGTFRGYTEWDAAWTAQERGEYEVAFSQEAGWAGLDQYAKAEWNAYFREHQKYEHVHRNYAIIADWDGTSDSESLFVEIDSETHVPYLGNVMVMPELPLFKGIDYEGAADQVDETGGKRLLPITVFIEKPNDPLTYVAIQNAHTVYGSQPIRNPNKLDFDVAVTANNESGPGFEVNISGAPQHALDPQFVPNDADPEDRNPNVWGGYDIRTMIVTAALQGERRPEHRIPDQVTGDLVRQRIITLEHSGLRMVHICTGTVVAIDRNGDTLTSDGGVLRDPLPQLEALARIAEKSLINPRKTVQIRTGRMVGGVNVGNMIKSIDGVTVNAVIRQIRINSPVVESADAPPTIMSIEATTNQIDLVSLVGRVPEPEVVTR